MNDKPLAADGLTSYRYRLPFSFVMIGAKDHNDAIRQAQRSITGQTADFAKLEVWSGDKYVPVVPLVDS